MELLDIPALTCKTCGPAFLHSIWWRPPSNTALVPQAPSFAGPRWFAWNVKMLALYCLEKNQCSDILNLSLSPIHGSKHSAHLQRTHSSIENVVAWGWYRYTRSSSSCRKTFPLSLRWWKKNMRSSGVPAPFSLNPPTLQSKDNT